MTDPRVDRLALLERQLEPGQPLAALDPEQVRARRLALQASLQHGVDLVLRARTRVHQLFAARQSATQHAAALIRHPHRLQLARPQQPGQRPRVQPIRFRARLRNASVVRADHDHSLDVRLKDPRDLPAAARHLQRHPIRLHQAVGQQHQPLRGARHATGNADLAVLTDRDHAEITVNVQTDRPTGPPSQRHLSPPLTQIERGGRTSGTTTQTDTCSQHNPGKSQGRPNEKPGLKAHRANRPTRLRSPNKAPVPDHPTLRPDPDGASTEHFHAATRITRGKTHRLLAADGRSSSSRGPRSVGQQSLSGQSSVTAVHWVW